MGSTSSYKIKLLLAFAAIYIIWGSAFFGVHIALKSFPPFLLSALRLLIAGLALLIFCVVKKEPFPAWADIKKNMVCGLVIFIGGIVAVVWAQQYISSSLASVIITTPFWFIVLDKRQWKFYFSSKWIILGIILGLAGVILLMELKEGRAGKGSAEMELLSIIIIIAGSFFWVSGSLYLKYKPSQSSVYVNTTIQLLSAGVFCIFLSWLNNENRSFSIDTVLMDGLLALLYLAIVSSLITFLAFMWLIKVQPPAIVSTYSYVNPLVATLLGWAFAGEHISSIQLIALFVILVGVLFVNVPGYQMIKS
jgi:drug/metabolite transporter (DMT)-like permease